MGSVLNPQKTYITDQGRFILSPLSVPIGSQTFIDSGINSLGTNIIKPLLNTNPPATLTYNFLNANGNPTGGYIQVNWLGDGINSITAQVIIQYPSSWPGPATGYTTSFIIKQGGTLINDSLYMTIYPQTDDIEKVTEWGFIAYDVTRQKYATETNTSYHGFYPLFLDASSPEDSNVIEAEGGIAMLDTLSDLVGFPGLPNIDFLDTHMISLYTLSLGQAQALSTYLWDTSPGAFWDNILKLFNDPMEAIIGFYTLPITATATPNQDIVIGNCNSSCKASKVTKQYYDISMGSVDVNNYFATYYDWAPFTTCEIYLPFIGTKELDINEIMGSTLELHYYVDALTGNCTAMLKVTRTEKNEKNENLASVLYHWNGNMKTECPITAKDMTQLMRTAIQSVTGVGQSAGNGAVEGFAAGGPAGAVGGAIGGAISGTVGAIPDLLTTPQPIKHSGNLAGSCGSLAVQTPYLILSRPSVKAPASIRHDSGLSSYITMTVGSCSGFTKFKSIHVTGITCTDDERREIEKTLTDGIVC